MTDDRSEKVSSRQYEKLNEKLGETQAKAAVNDQALNYLSRQLDLVAGRVDTDIRELRQILNDMRSIDMKELAELVNEKQSLVSFSDYKKDISDPLRKDVDELKRFQVRLLTYGTIILLVLPPIIKWIFDKIGFLGGAS